MLVCHKRLRFHLASIRIGICILFLFRIRMLLNLTGMSFVFDMVQPECWYRSICCLRDMFYHHMRRRCHHRWDILMRLANTGIRLWRRNLSLYRSGSRRKMVVVHRSGMVHPRYIPQPGMDCSIPATHRHFQQMLHTNRRLDSAKNRG